METEIKKEHEDLFELLEKLSEEESVIILDEAQYLRFSKMKFDEMLAYFLDNLEGITFVVTGSEVGLLRDLLKFEDPQSPLYARMHEELVLPCFSEDKSIEFLKRGFEEVKVSVANRELEEAARTLGGVPGWLTFYGYCRYKGRSHEEALREVREYARKLLMKELNDAIRGSPTRYLTILKAIAEGLEKWSDIKAYTVGKLGKMDDKTFSRLLKKLVKMSLVEKTTDGRYKLADPLLREAIKEMRI